MEEINLDLWQAVWEGDVSTLRGLLDEDDDADVNCLDAGHSMLHFAAKWGHVPMVEILLEFNADTVCQDGDQKTPIHWAVEGGELPEIQCLNARGTGYVDEKDSWRQYTTVVDLILTHSGDNASKASNTKDNTGRIPLHYAAEKNNLDIVKLLLASGSSVNTPDEDLIVPIQLATDGQVIKVLENAESEAVKHALSAAQAQVSQEGGLLAPSDEEVALQTRVNDLTAENELNKQTVIALKEELKAVKAQIPDPEEEESRKKDIQALQEEIGDLRVKNKVLSELNSQLEAAAKEKEKVKQSTSDAGADAENENEREKLLLKEKVSDLSAQVAEERALGSMQAEELAELKKKHEEKCNEVSRLERDIARLRKESELSATPSAASAVMKAEENVAAGDEPSTNSVGMPVYPLERLQRCAPISCVRTKLEDYLSDDEFAKHFAMPRDEFKALPLWKRNTYKKKISLY